jgi:hypothetical protein
MIEEGGGRLDGVFSDVGLDFSKRRELSGESRKLLFP